MNVENRTTKPETIKDPKHYPESEVKTHKLFSISYNHLQQ